MPQRLSIVNDNTDVQIKDEVEDKSKSEVIAAQKEVEMNEAAAKLEQNQKLLEETLRKQRSTESKATESSYHTEAEKVKMQQQAELKY